MMERTTTIRIRSSTAKALSKLGVKGETYDQIIRKLLPHAHAYDPAFLKSLHEAAKERGIPEKRIPWDKIHELSEEEIDELLGTM